MFALHVTKVNQVVKPSHRKEGQVSDNLIKLTFKNLRINLKHNLTVNYIYQQLFREVSQNL